MEKVTGGYIAEQGMRQIALRVFLSFTLVFTMLGIQPAEARAVEPWAAEDFTISGSAIVGLSASGQAKLSEAGNTIDFPSIEGVTTISSGFANKGISVINLASGYTTIGEGAFQENNLGSLSLPATITTIEKGAFQNNQLSGVLSIPSSLSSLGAYAFASNSISEINFQTELLTNIPASAFQDNNLSSLSLPSAVTSIESLAFANNLLDSQNTIGLSGVQSIGSKAFYNNHLKTVSLPSVSSATGSIANDSFSGNGQVVGITAAHIAEGSTLSSFTAGDGHIVNPITVTVSYVDGGGTPIKSNDTYGADFTSDKLYSKGASVSVEAPPVSGYILDDSLSKAAVEVDGVYSVSFTYKSTIGAVTVIASDRAFKNGETITIEALLEGVSAISELGGDVTISVSPAEGSGVTFPHVPTGVGSFQVEYRAVDAYGNVHTKTITVQIIEADMDGRIGSSLWQYSDFTYDGGTLTGFSDQGKDKIKNEPATYASLTLPGVNPNPDNSHVITAIEAGAFSEEEYCKFTNIDFSELVSLTTIGDNVFQNAQIETLDLSNHSALTTIGANFLSNCDTLRTVDLSNTGISVFGTTGTDGLSSTAFQNCRSGITSINLSNCESLTSIGSFSQADTDTVSAFSGLTELNLEGCSALTTISSTFAKAPLTSLTFPEDSAITSIGAQAFRDAVLADDSLDLSSLTKLAEIGDDAFQNSLLTKLDMSNCASLKKIGKGAL